MTFIPAKIHTGQLHIIADREGFGLAVWKLESGKQGHADVWRTADPVALGAGLRRSQRPNQGPCGQNSHHTTRLHCGVKWTGI